IGLNKREALHALARQLFFGRLGELRDRAFEDQMHRASCLHLLMAAIAAWNTVYLTKAIEGSQNGGDTYGLCRAAPAHCEGPAPHHDRHAQQLRVMPGQYYVIVMTCFAELTRSPFVSVAVAVRTMRLPTSGAVITKVAIPWLFAVWVPK